MACPNCTIALTYFAQTTTNPEPRFSYHRTAGSCGWQVQPHGSIVPPSRNRIVQLNVTGYPDSPSAAFTGFQMVAQPEDFPPISDPWTSLQDLSALGVTALNPETLEPITTWPPSPGTHVLAFDFGTPSGTSSSTRFYRLAVNGFWDPDPKVYNDPAQ